MSEKQALEIEDRAASKSYKCGFGVSEWEAFLSYEDVENLIALAEQGFGTWGREPKRLSYIKLNYYSQKWASLLIDNNIPASIGVANNVIYCYEYERGLAKRRVRPDWIPKEYKVVFEYVGKIRP